MQLLRKCSVLWTENGAIALTEAYYHHLLWVHIENNSVLFTELKFTFLYKEILRSLQRQEKHFCRLVEHE